MNTPATIPCPTCGYNLRGLLTFEGATCPECGQHHTAAALNGLAPPESRRWALAILLTPLIMLVPWAAFSLLPLQASDFAIPICLSLAGGLLWSWNAAHRSRTLRPNAGSSTTEHILAHFALVLLAISITMVAIPVAFFTGWAVLILLHATGIL